LGSQLATDQNFLVARWRSLDAKDKCLFFWFLACHATIAASPLISPLISQQNEKSNLSGTQGIITLIYSKAQNLAFQQNVSMKCNIHTAIKGETHKSCVTVTESSMSKFVNVLAKASNFFLLISFSWNYAGILLSSLY